MRVNRELDALVAEQVFGQKSHKSFEDPDFGVYYYDDSDHSAVPRYSSDIAAAWSIVEKLWTEGFLVEVTTGTTSWYVKVSGDDDGYVVGGADSAPEAICVAALKWKRHETLR